MSKLIIEPTRHTPKIEFDILKGYLLIEGDSYPENAMEIYQPLFDKMEVFFQSTQQKLTVELLVDYLNTSSSKVLTDFLNKLQWYHREGHDIKLTWFYPEGDVDLMETCEMFLDDLIFPHFITEIKE